VTFKIIQHNLSSSNWVEVSVETKHQLD